MGHAIRIEPLPATRLGADGYSLMRQLRPALRSESVFRAQLTRQSEAGYRLFAATSNRTGLVGLAGYRLMENFVHGRFLYVDDLVVKAGWRDQGIGHRLLSVLESEAQRQGCKTLVLDTDTGNAAARALYDGFGLVASAVHYRSRSSLNALSEFRDPVQTPPFMSR